MTRVNAGRVAGRRLRVAALALAAVALATGAVVAGSRGAAGSGAATTTGGTLDHAGRWLVDGSGRVVVIHGVNMPSKLLPAYPAALGFGDDDAAMLARLGFNAVRLTVERYAVEPKSGQFDAGYVGHMADTVRMLAAHGIYSLIDFHQDEFGPVFFDNGYPDWMTVTDGLPNLWEVGFPEQYLANPALNRAFDHLWADDPDSAGRPLQADDAGILAGVAAGLRDLPGLLGYEIINEPWPGTQYPHCIVVATGCQSFDQDVFSRYYQRTVPAIRAVDHTHMIWYEPLVTFNQGTPTYVIPPRDDRLGFAFHDYGLCGAADDAGLPVATGQPCAPEDARVLSNALAHVAATGDALLETEFGATMNTSTLTAQAGQYDRSMIPWLFWSYTRYIDKLAADGTLLPATDANLNHPIVAALARPYPQLVSGTPTAWSYDPSTSTFTMSYSVARVTGHGSFPVGAVTNVAVPAVQYPNGYGVIVKGGKVISAAGAPLLQIAACPRAATVSLTVSAAPAVQSAC